MPYGALTCLCGEITQFSSLGNNFASKVFYKLCVVSSYLFSLTLSYRTSNTGLSRVLAGITDLEGIRVEGLELLRLANRNSESAVDMSG